MRGKDEEEEGIIRRKKKNKRGNTERLRTRVWCVFADFEIRDLPPFQADAAVDAAGSEWSLVICLVFSVCVFGLPPAWRASNLSILL